MDSIYKIVLMLKLVYKFKVVYSFMVVLRATKLGLHDHSCHSTSVNFLSSLALPNSVWKWSATLINGDV
jgi:hypothetical protein